MMHMKSLRVGGQSPRRIRNQHRIQLVGTPLVRAGETVCTSYGSFGSTAACGVLPHFPLSLHKAE